MADVSGSADRKLPQAQDAEVAVLGAMLLNPDAVARVIQQLGTSADHFYLRFMKKCMNN